MADVSGMTLQNASLNSFYQNALKTLPVSTIDRATISTPEQSVDSIAQQVQAYLQPYYNNSVRQRQAQTAQYQAEIDSDAASRGIGASTWVTDFKARQQQAEASDIANLNGQYTSDVAKNVAEQYENYLNRRANVDQVNAGNQIEVDKWNSQVTTAMEQLAYQRALEEYARSGIGSGSGGSYGGSGGKSKGGFEETDTVGSYQDALATLKALGAGTRSAADYLLTGVVATNTATKKAQEKAQTVTLPKTGGGTKKTTMLR